MAEKHYPPVHKALKKYYGYDSFRPGQLDLIHALLDGRDVCAIMPTGAGKSVCFQIPAVFMDGITLVISPLISLMKDQVASLIQARIPAAYLNSSLTFGQYKTALARARQGRYKIIYVAPERLNTPAFLDFAQNANISMIAVDEAHCVSQWGQNFRPSYLEIPKFAASLKKRPIMAAFTATATGPVKDDIIRQLDLHSPLHMTTGFDRSNLFFEVRQPKDKFKALLSFLEKHPHESGIVYCLTRKETEEVASRLNAQGYPCGCYHGGMPPEARSIAQDDFLYDRTPLIAATNAFGMGIDKSNVRFVVHYSIPSSLENYYQEAGRAGRDGAPAHCLLLYKPGDIMINKFLIEQSNQDSPEQETRELHRLRVMENYCKTPMCLRSYILQYFGETSSGTCSGCSNCAAEWIEEDISKEAASILKGLKELPRSYGLALILDFLKGKNTAKLRNAGFTTFPSYGILAAVDFERIRMIAEFLLMKGYLLRSADRWQTVSFSREFARMIESGEPIVMRRKKLKEDLRKKPLAFSYSEEETGTGPLYEKLKAVRLQAARNHRLPPYLIFSDATLQEMAVRLPVTPDELMDISGVGQYKCDKYGKSFITAIKAEIERRNAIEARESQKPTAAKTAVPQPSKTADSAENPQKAAPETPAEDTAKTEMDQKAEADEKKEPDQTMESGENPADPSVPSKADRES